MRERLYLAMYVAYVDENGKGGPVFVFGGLIATPDKWIAFTKRWDEVLAADPPIPFYKYRNPHRLSVSEHCKKPPH